jgi:hypothetical protein
MRFLQLFAGAALAQQTFDIAEEETNLAMNWSRAFALCDTSRGGMVSTSEFNRCIHRFGANACALRKIRASTNGYFRTVDSQVNRAQFR